MLKHATGLKLNPLGLFQLIKSAVQYKAIGIQCITNCNQITLICVAVIVLATVAQRLSQCRFPMDNVPSRRLSAVARLGALCIVRQVSYNTLSTGCLALRRLSTSQFFYYLIGCRLVGKFSTVVLWPSHKFRWLRLAGLNYILVTCIFIEITRW